ncbi:MAG: XcyI family restriction endonuclease, partial [Treponema sp.]|nr:XcyI family restriction endonuclease [Treponema sp.]
MASINIPVPILQINFSKVLKKIRETYLQEALSETIDKVNLSKLDKELNEGVPEKYLKLLAKHGLRGELIFPVPCLLEANPFLLGYYRLLLGFSQKEFYGNTFGVSVFKTMETKGVLLERTKDKLSDLCKALIRSAIALTDGIGTHNLCGKILDDLTLLTIGPQLRGGENVEKGTSGIVNVFNAIFNIVEKSIIFYSSNKIELENAAGRKVLIEFTADPDIVIREEIGENRYRNIVAIEVKGGKDFSNIHNRVGEAEKSHQKAKQFGYVECWTVVNVDRIDIEMAKRESPSTNSFYVISKLISEKGNEYQDFKERIISLTGIKVF